jgi:glycolate oxidase iron-sulfur subunit
MQTNFTAEQLADPATADSERNLRACVHCGFCLTTCPTFDLLGDERDSPRGRIYAIKDMLEHDRPATAEVALHIDRCLSCLACVTACPSGVNYQHLIDHARAHVEETYRRPLADRLLRSVLAWLLPFPDRFRLALGAARLVRPLRRFATGRLGALLALTPAHLPRPGIDESVSSFPALGERKARVAMLAGCAQRAIAPSINAATIRLLNRHGVEVIVPPQAGCCGAIVHHLGKAEQARALAIATMKAWMAEIERGGLDAIVVNASGCGTEIKDYGHIFRDDPVWAEPARRISALARDMRPAPFNMGNALPFRPRRCSRRRDLPCAMCRTGIFAAVRQAPIICSNPKSRTACATRRSAISRAPGPILWRQAISAA